MGRPVTGVLDSVFQSAADLAAAGRSYLGSQEGKRLRENVSKIVIVGAPLLSQLPAIRRTPVARFLRTAAFAALMVKGAEWLRDWEPRTSISEPSVR
ncbi:MAG: hypothetical protein ACRDGU_03025 [Actinomycetota bacterium]